MNGKKRIHIVSGGFNQIPLVKKAKAMGFEVLLTDMYENPPAKQFADHFERIDTTHKEATLKAAQKFKAEYVVTDQTDVAVPTVAYVAEEMGLPGIGYETSLKFTNKHLMRQALLPTLAQHLPESHFFSSRDEALEFCRQVKPSSDYLIKPVNSQGSKGVSILDKGQMEMLVHEAFSESMERGALVERCIRGFEFSVETFVKDGNVHNLTLTKKYHYRDNPCLDERNTFLGDVSPELEKSIFDTNEKIIKTMGLQFGMTHAEYKVENGRVFLIEIAARGAGGSISSYIIPYLTRFDNLEALLNTMTDVPFDIRIDDYKKRFAVLKFFNFAPGKIKQILLNQAQLDSALVFSLDVKPGQTIKRVKDSRDRPGYFVVHGPDREQVLKQERATEAAVQLEYC
jgi:biotin carboxylase